MKLYKCIDCGNVFEAADYAESCSRCGSDNITPAKKMSPIVKGVLIALLGIPVGLGISVGLSKIFDDKPVAEVDIDGRGEITIDGHTPSHDVDVITASDIPEIIAVSELQYKSGGYTFEATARTERRTELRFELFDPNNTFTSSDGKFENIPYTDEGVYTLKVINTKNGAYTDMMVSGFVKPPQMVTPLTKADIQKIIDNPTQPFTKAMAAKFGKYKMEFVGLDPEEPEPLRFSEILNALVGNAWKSATVMEEPRYDELNRIIYLKVKVEYYN